MAKAGVFKAPASFVFQSFNVEIAVFFKTAIEN